MKSPRIINVWDILTKVWRDDNLILEELQNLDIPWLTSTWITVHLHLVSINETDILVTIWLIECLIKENCDYSDKEYERECIVEDEKILFSTKPSEDYLKISPMMTIDMKEPIYQLIKLQEPVQKVHPNYIFND